MTRLKLVPLAVGLGVTWGAGIMLLGWVSAGGWGANLVQAMSSVYRGYTSTFLGGVVGGLWGFGDAFLGGLLFAALYNFFAGERHSEAMHVIPQTEEPAR